jgi:hypothetical protein
MTHQHQVILKPCAAQSKSVPHRPEKTLGVAETKLPTFSESLMLVRKGKKPKPEILKPKEVTGTLVAGMLDATSSPGLARGACPLRLRQCFHIGVHDQMAALNPRRM